MNPRRPRKRNAPPRPRDRFGRYLPTTTRARNETNPRRPRKRNEENPRKAKKRNPSTYPGAPMEFNPRRPRKRNAPRRGRKGRYLPAYNPVSYPAYPGYYAQEVNPRRPRKRNPNGMPTTFNQWIAPAAAMIGGFCAPGVMWYLIGDSGRNKTIGWFSKSTHPEAKARFVVSAGTTALLYFLSTRIDFIKAHQFQWMLGSIARTAKDGADAILSAEPGSFGLKLRMIFSLPITSTITPSKAQLEGTAPRAQVSGLWYDASTDGWKYGSQALDAQYNETTGELGEMLQLGMVAGQAPPATGQLAPIQQDRNLIAQRAGITGVPSNGVGEVIPMTADKGVGEIYIDRQIKPAKQTPPRQAGVGEIYVNRQIQAEGYKGIGALYVDKNKVYYEQGQRYPAIIGF